MCVAIKQASDAMAAVLLPCLRRLGLACAGSANCVLS